MSYSVAIKKVLVPPKLRWIRRYAPARPLKVLDVGCGNDSCKLTKFWLNVDQYHGVDKSYWNGQKEDYARMDKIFFLDLDENALEDLPEQFYDVVIFSHVIEHLANGYSVLGRLGSKVAPGGVIYVETPSYRTLNFPRAIGFLNFYDDVTHKRLYDVHRIIDTLMDKNLEVLRFGTRRDWLRLILLSPVAVVLNLFWYLPVKKKIFGTGLWDLLGVACFVVAKRPDTQLH